MYIWILQNPKKMYDEVSSTWGVYFLMHLIITILEAIGTMMFWFWFFCSMFLYFFFKHQNNISLMLPHYDDPMYIHFIVWMSIVFFCKLATIIIKLIKQCRTDIYVLDGENTSQI